MKHLIPLSLLILFLMANCSGPKSSDSGAMSEEPAKPLIGAWKLTGGTIEYPDTTIAMSVSAESPEIKILSATHWSFGYQESDSTMFGGGGTYTYDGETYTESIQYHTASNVVGQVIKFDIQIEGNTWTHTGKLPTSDGTEITLKEIWEKIE